jgi:hypothetical protein
VSHGGKNDVLKHVGRRKHIQASEAANSSHSIVSMFQGKGAKVAQSVTESEARWALFVAKHNLAFLTSDHATKLFHKMFPDSDIAKQFACGRTKTTAVVKEALSPHYLEKVISNIKVGPFSIMMDESNDKTNKSCIILVRIFDCAIGDVRTRFLDMPAVNIGTASNLFSAVKASLLKHGLDFSKAIAFMSDTANVMKGARSGVQKLIKDENPHVYDVGCICHLADLTVKAGMKALPVDIDQLFVDTFYHFHHSSKRTQEFADMWSEFYSGEPEKILKHCPTRWLSLLRCVNRYLTQYDGMKSYFLSCADQNSRVRGIIAQLESPLTKPLLLFLSYILPHMDRFNRLFQKSDENTTNQLHTEMCRLTRLYAANLLKEDVIISAGSALDQLSLQADSQLPDENLGIGVQTWKFVAELEEEEDTKPFFNAVRAFYVKTIEKMKKKFPFNDTLLKDLGVMQPNLTMSVPVGTIVRLAQRFPQIGLSSPESLTKLKEEFLDFRLSQWDIPPPKDYVAADESRKPRVGAFWHTVSMLKTIDGHQRFKTLSSLMFGLMTIPASNADSEWGFSSLRKIHTDQRANLDQSTMVALLATKLNCDECCHTCSFTNELLTSCKKATAKVVKTNNSEH